MLLLYYLIDFYILFDVLLIIRLKHNCTNVDFAFIIIQVLSIFFVTTVKNREVRVRYGIFSTFSQVIILIDFILKAMTFYECTMFPSDHLPPEKGTGLYKDLFYYLLENIEVKNLSIFTVSKAMTTNK